MKHFPTALLLGLIVAEAAAAGGSGNPLFDALVQHGVAVPGGPTVKLPAPLVKPGTVPQDPAAVLDQAAGRVPVELFVKKTVTAPFAVVIDSVEAPGGARCAQSINLWFIAYGKLAALNETDFVKQLLGGKSKKGGAGKEAIELSAAALKERGIARTTDPKVREDYGTLYLSLLDKVQVEGVTHGLRTTAPHTILYAVQLDDRFAKDKEYPNQWRAVERSAEGEKLGPPHAYAGLAGYVQVTELPAPKGALLVEMHFIVHEPPAWFGGPNLLRSKLPIAIQDNVRSFRRKLAHE